MRAPRAEPGEGPSKEAREGGCFNHHVVARGATSVASFLAAVLTEIYLCNVCSCHENIETQRPWPGTAPTGSADNDPAVAGQESVGVHFACKFADPGYKGTALMLANAGLCLALGAPLVVCCWGCSGCTSRWRVRSGHHESSTEEETAGADEPAPRFAGGVLTPATALCAPSLPPPPATGTRHLPRYGCRSR
eukprot:COSAG01_NODE_30_length_36127_cov_41.433234_22_plen_192_part_00